MEHEENVVFGTNFKCALRRDFPKRNLFFWVQVTSLTLKVSKTHFQPLFKQIQYGLLRIQGGRGAGPRAAPLCDP